MRRAGKVVAGSIACLIFSLSLAGGYRVSALAEQPDYAAPPETSRWGVPTSASLDDALLPAPISPRRISDTMETLTKRHGSRAVSRPGNALARDYLVAELEAMGYSRTDGTLVVQPFKCFGNPTENIIAIIPAKEFGAKILTVSSHYDSALRGEGAIDNGSGIAALLETARVILEAGLPPYTELRFVFFSGEEEGYLGAIHYLENLSDDERARHIGVFNVDMAGYATTGAPPLLSVSTKGEPTACGWDPAPENIISRSVATAYYMLGLNPMPFASPVNAGKHDTVPFYNAGVTTATLSWREIDFAASHANTMGVTAPRDIHLYEDTLENIDLDSIVLTTKLVVLSVVILNEKSQI